MLYVTVGLKVGWKSACKYGAHKTSARKIRIIKKTKQTSSVPAWVIARTRRSVRTNPKRRDWRHAHARLG